MNNNKKTDDEISINFLLVEFAQKNEYWQHVDKRIDDSINLFLGFLTLILPVAFFTYENISNVSISNLSLISFSIIISISGYLLVIRLYNAVRSKSTAMFSLNLIKKYFVDRDSEIDKYLYYHIYEPEKDKKRRKFKFHKNFTKHFHTVFTLLIPFSWALLL